MGKDNLSGKKKYNNGSIAKYFIPGTQPEGWELGDTIEKKLKNSEASKRNWENKEFREKQHKTRSSEEYKEKMKPAREKAWEHYEEKCAKLKEAANRRFNNEEEHTKCSQRMKDKWKDEEYYKNQCKSLKESHKNLYDIHPEYKEKLSISAIKSWELNKEDILSKQHITKTHNNSWNSSKLEEEYYNYLCNEYGEDDIIRQYYNKDTYPFYCDFYIKSEDKYIEIQGSWTHGPHPYDASNEEDRKLLNEWENKSLESKFYKIAIEVWTIKDPYKMEVAKKNNLNIEFIY